MKFFKALAFTTAVTLMASAASANDVETLMKQCNDCHGDNGVSQWNDVPTIAGITDVVHADALFIYRDKARACSDSKYRQGDTSRAPVSMCTVAEGLSDSDIEAVAAAYAEKPFVRAKQEFDASLAAAGKIIHEEQCDRCHSDAGTNVDDEASMLGGQRMGYLESAFAEYASGAREQPAKMKEKLDELSGDEIKSLLHYYGSVQ